MINCQVDQLEDEVLANELHLLAIREGIMMLIDEVGNQNLNEVLDEQKRQFSSDLLMNFEQESIKNHQVFRELKRLPKCLVQEVYQCKIAIKIEQIFAEIKNDLLFYQSAAQEKQPSITPDLKPSEGFLDKLLKVSMFSFQSKPKPSPSRYFVSLQQQIEQIQAFHKTCHKAIYTHQP